jgi:Matrixin
VLARGVTIVSFLLAVAVLGVAAPRARAYRIGGQPWPSQDVTYYSAGSPHANALIDKAARVWNRAQVGVHLVRSPSPSAQVLVSGAPGRCRGISLIGYPGAYMSSSWAHIGRCPKKLMVLVMAHEFGHVLGLGHEPRRCALMNPGVDSWNGTPSRCRSHSLRYWMKHTLLRDDVAGAKALAVRSAALRSNPPVLHTAHWDVEPELPAPAVGTFAGGLF